MIKTLLIGGLIFVAAAQALISIKLFKLMRRSETNEVVSQRKKLDKLSRTIQVVALMIVLVFIFNGGLSK
ncbi:MAG: hypothetical protein ACREBU_08970 [Nitrososphaera sp.]